MALIVQKYGGTSVGTVERIKNVARRVARYKGEGHQLVVVVSATGEQVTIGLLAIALHQIGLRAKSYTGGQVRILTDSAFTKARILSIDEVNMRRDLEAGNVLVVAGFQGEDDA